MPKSFSGRPSLRTLLLLDHLGGKQLRQRGSKDRGNNQQYEHRVEHLLVQQPHPRRVESVVADQGRSERGSNLRQRQRPHRQPRLTRVAESTAGYGRSDSFADDQRSNDACNQPELLEDSLRYRIGGNKEASDNEEDWNEESAPHEFQLFLRRMVMSRRIDRYSGQESSDDVW